MDAEEAGQAISATIPTPAWWLVLGTGLFAIAVSISAVRPGALTHFNVLDTLLHEFGHAAVGVLTGGSASRLQISSPDAGVTSTRVAPGFSTIAMSAAGYLFPPLSGLGSAYLLEREHAPGVLALLTAVTLLVLPIARGLLTIATVVGIGTLCLLTFWYGAPFVQNTLAYMIAWMLLWSAPTSLLPLVQVRLFGRVGDDDAAGLHDDTGIPGCVWIAGWFAVAVWCLWSGVGLLWP